MRTKLFAVLALVALFGAACGDDDGAAVRETGSNASASGSGSASASGTASGSGSESAEECEIVNGVDDAATGELHVELNEYTIKMDKATIAAGKIKFEAKNEGAEDHEIAIVRTVNGAKLAAAEDGSAEEGDGLIGEIEPFASGQECEGTFELATGTYAVICNIVEEEANGEKEAHYKEGMSTTLTVS